MKMVCPSASREDAYRYTVCEKFGLLATTLLQREKTTRRLSLDLAEDSEITHAQIEPCVRSFSDGGYTKGGSVYVPCTGQSQA